MTSKVSLFSVITSVNAKSAQRMKSLSARIEDYFIEVKIRQTISKSISVIAADAVPFGASEGAEM